MESHSLLILD